MKKFELLLCFVLCVLPCVFTLRGTPTSNEELAMIAKTIDITPQELHECLTKAGTDWDTIMEMSDLVLGDIKSQTKETIKKVGCFGACLYKKNGMMANSKINAARVLELIPKVTRRPEDLAFLRKAIVDCSKQVGNIIDECDATVSFSHCVVDIASRQP